MFFLWTRESLLMLLYTPLIKHIFCWLWVTMFGIWLFCQSEYRKYFDAETACFDSLLEFLEYILLYKSLTNINAIFMKCVKKKNNNNNMSLWGLSTYYHPEFISQPVRRSGLEPLASNQWNGMKAMVRASLVPEKLDIRKTIILENLLLSF